MGKLSLKGKHTNLKDIIVGDGYKLPISCIETVVVKTLTGTLVIKVILIVPLIKKYLLNIS